MGSLMLRLRTWWETADRTQKVVTLFGGAFLIVLLVGTFYFASKPKMQPAFVGLSMTELGTVTEEIRKMGVPMEFDEQGNVLVPADKVAFVKAQLAVSGKLPAGNAKGAADLDKITMVTTPAVERERLKAILEGQVAESIQFIDGVASARVHITLGDDSPFVDDRKPATASVTIAERTEGSLGAEQARAIARLVAFAAPGLDTRHVTIVNQAGRLLFDGNDQAGATGIADRKLQAEIAESKRRERELQGMLDAAFGPGATIAKVTLELDFDERETTSVERRPSENPTTVVVAQEDMNGAESPSAGGLAGAASNLPAAPVAAAGASAPASSYKGTKEQKVYTEDEIRTRTVPAAGSIKSMAVTVLADSKKFQDDAELQRIVEGFIGPKAADTENFKSTVSLVEFDTSVKEAAEKAKASSAMAQRIQQALSFLPILAMLVVAFMVVKAIGKAAKEQGNVLVAATPDGTLAPIAALEEGGHEGTHDPQAALGESARQESDGTVARQSLPQPEIEAIPEHLNVPMEQVRKMAEERPHAVAMLVKSWLLEDRR